MDFSQYRQQLTIADKQLSYLDIGTGPALLLGHSYLWDAEMWASQLEALSRHYRCIVPDLWGHGHSDLLPKNCRSLTDIATQMLQLMDSLSIEQFSVIGLSVGGMWGAELALQAPTRVQSLVMLGCFIGFEPEVTRAKYYAMLDTIKQARCVPEPLIETIVPLFFAESTLNNDPAVVQSFTETLSAIPPERIDTIFALGRMIFGRRDTMEEAEKLTLPSLIMSGVEDKARTVLEGYLMHDAIDGSEFIHIPAAGHISTLEQAPFINEQLLRFLDQHVN